MSFFKHRARIAPLWAALVLSLTSCADKADEAPTLKTVTETEYDVEQRDTVEPDPFLKERVKTVSYYDDSGNITRREYWLKGTFFETRTLKRDDHGRLLEVVFAAAHGEVKKRLVHELDEAGRTVEVRSYFGVDRLSAIHSREYDSKGNRVSEIHKSPDSIVLSKRLFEYDNKNNVVKETELRQDGSVKVEMDFKYDDSGRLIESKSISEDWGNIPYTIEYTQYGDVASRSWVDGDAGTQRVVYEYDYDEFGNWTNREKYDNGALIYVQKRVMEYY